MGMKRKRSGSSGLSPFSSTSETSRGSSSPSPFHGGDWAMLDGDVSMGDLCFVTTHQAGATWEGDATESHLHSRTRKRVRDNRPEESIIHQNTYQKLFQAQKNPPLVLPPRPASACSSSASSFSQTAATATLTTTTKQASLHNFWNLPGRRPTTSQSLDSALPPTAFHALSSSEQQPKKKCEDCDQWLDLISDDDCAMELDDSFMGGGGGGVHDGQHCRCCRRLVCDTCSVTYIGDGRECLHCRTSPKRWVGGIGWI